MRLSQLTRRMDRQDEIRVCLFGAPLGRAELYCGAVRGIRREDPMNKMFVNHVCACDDTIVIELTCLTAVAASTDRKSGEP